jgi:hypothetical protein
VHLELALNVSYFFYDMVVRWDFLKRNSSEEERFVFAKVPYDARGTLNVTRIKEQGAVRTGCFKNFSQN